MLCLRANIKPPAHIIISVLWQSLMYNENSLLMLNNKRDYVMAPTDLAYYRESILKKGGNFEAKLEGKNH